MPMIIAIDGPAGAGKSTVTKQVAARLGMLYLDTGAMYRAATLGLQQSGVAVDDDEAIAHHVCHRHIDFDERGGVRLDGEPLGEQIRTPEVTREIWRVANNAHCREYLVGLQQQIVCDRDSALEGRDATTVICPDATLKVYLDASPEERARRRLAEWQQRGVDAPPLQQIVNDIRERDERDMNREVGALTMADDAMHVVTDGLAPESVIATIIAHAVKRRPLLLEPRIADQVHVGRSRQAGYVQVAEGSINDPPQAWKLGLTNPSSERLPGKVRTFARNTGGRQAGVLCQGRAVIAVAGNDDHPSLVQAMPMLPQTWYVIEPGVWHAVAQESGTVCAWAESSAIVEAQLPLSAEQQAVLQAYTSIYLPTSI